MKRISSLSIILFLLAAVACRNELITDTSESKMMSLLTSLDPPELSTVEPLYQVSGRNWNDYVRNDGTNRFNASDNPCTGAETSGYTVCLHGGEMRTVTVTNKTKCGVMKALDNLDAFNWRCDDSTGTARFISTGLKKDKNLSDLIDFTSGNWKSMTVTVSEFFSSKTTTPVQWWGNTIINNPSGANPYDLNAPGTVYTMTANNTTRYRILADKISVVTRPGLVITGDAAAGTILFGLNSNFLWIEASVDVAGNARGIEFNQVKFSMVKNSKIQNADQIAARGIVLSNNSMNNMFSHITLSNNACNLLLNDANYNIFTDLTTSNAHANYGVAIGVNSHNNTLINICSHNNNSDAMRIDTPSNSNIVINYTGAQSAVGNGIAIINSANSTLMNTAFVNTNFGLNINGGSRGTTILNIASSANNWGIELNTSLYNYFTGQVKSGSNTTNCNDAASIQPGLASITCAELPPSDFGIPDTALTMAASFAGKVTSDDISNPNDSSGIQLHGGIINWLFFDNGLRGWGFNGSFFPASDNRKACLAGDTCTIWDWSLAAGDTAIRNVLPVPSGNDFLYHKWFEITQPACESIPGAVWQDMVCSNPGYFTAATCTGAAGTWSIGQCSSLILRNAYEITGDGIGNENGLCESGEHCIYTPNIGAYQGHGELDPMGYIVNGMVTDVYLYRYRNNGR